MDSCCGCSDDGYVVGLTKMVVHCFQKKDADGTVHTERKWVPLHFFLDTQKRIRMKAELSTTLMDILNLVNGGMPVEGLSVEAQKLFAKHIRYRTVRKKQVAYINDQSVTEACKYDGILAVVGYGNHICTRDTKTAFRTYIRREHIEDHFRAEKQSVDGNTIRSWYGDNYMGRLIIQFIALIYQDVLLHEIKRIKKELADDITQSKVTDKDKTISGKKQKLLTWLNKQSMYSLLSGFDAIDETGVYSQIKSRRWNTEVLERDHMFLTMLGVTAFD